MLYTYHFQANLFHLVIFISSFQERDTITYNFIILLF